MAIIDKLATYAGNKLDAKEVDLQDIISIKNLVTLNLDSRYLVVPETFVEEKLIDHDVFLGTIDGADVNLEPGVTYYILPAIVAFLHKVAVARRVVAANKPTITQEGRIFVAYDTDISTSQILGIGNTADEAEDNYLKKYIQINS